MGSGEQLDRNQACELMRFDTGRQNEAEREPAACMKLPAVGAAEVDPSLLSSFGCQRGNKTPSVNSI